MPAEPTNSIRQNATKVIRDIPCPFCSCLCDDLAATVQGEKVVSINGACEAAMPWFVGKRPSEPPECRVDGRRADVSEAIERAAELLATARYPLVYGLSRGTCEAQGVAVEIAELLEGVLDVPVSCGAMEALQSVGEISCSYGEIRNRADLIVVWNADIATTHPRFIERFVRRDALASTSRGRKPGTPPTHVIAIETKRRSVSSDSFAHERIVVREGSEFDVVTTLRALLKGSDPNPADVERRTGVALDAFRKLADSMKQARYGVMLTTASSDDSAAARTREAFAALVRDLNESTRFALVELPSAPNVIGAADVVAWRTGYPPSIDFWRGDPSSNLAEFTADKLLMSHEIDAALLICDDLIGRIGKVAKRALASIPTVAIDWQQTATTAAAQIAIPVGLPGVESGGTMFRGDGVPFALRPPVTSPFSADHEALRAIRLRLERTRPPKVV